MIKLGELKRVDPRQVWADEARDFTPWLAQNLTRLSEALSMDLELTTREAPVGDFRCDLLARDIGSNRIVIIESQFGFTDHDHLGKILTYAAGLDAEAVIWVAEKMREEHRETLESNARVGQPQNWYSFPSGIISGVDYSTSFAQGGRVRAEVYIDFGGADKNKALFDRLNGQREVLEGLFGEQLSWERLDERRASRVAVYRDGSIDASAEELGGIRAWAIDRLLKFRSVFGPKIREEGPPSPAGQ